jgi:hypothetical protein
MFENDTCTIHFWAFGREEWDLTAFITSALNAIPLMEWFNKFLAIVRTTPAEWSYWIRNFNMLEAFKSNDYNPLWWFAEWSQEASFFQALFFESTATLSGSPPDDVFMSIFGEELYGVFYNHLILTAKPIIEEIKWRIANKDQILAHPMLVWFLNLFGLSIPTAPELISWIIGFEPECYGVQQSMYMKLVRVALLIPAWIMYIFLFIIRAISLVVYAIIYFLFSIQSMIFDFFFMIFNWIHLNIYMPIYNLFLPLYSFIYQIQAFFMWLIMIPFNFLMAIHFIIWSFLMSIQWLIACFFLWLHDWLWSIYWFVVMFLWNLIWPIIQWVIYILWFIPMFILSLWYWLMTLIWTPLDGICVSFFQWLEGVLDAILEAVPAPEWEPTWFELGMAQPILALNYYLDALV